MKSVQTVFSGILLIALSACSQNQPASDLALADVFQDHAVLQRDKPVSIWGQAAPNSSVHISLFETSIDITANAEGNWHASLPAQKAGGPYTLSVSNGDETITRTDILLGDIWLCSGQSNMEFRLKYATNAEIAVAQSANESIRLLQIQRQNALAPQTTLPSGSIWTHSTPETAAEFSAVCQFMGRDIQNATKTPIGLIDASWGGSVIQDWISPTAMQNAGGYEAGYALQKIYADDKTSGEKAFSNAIDKWAQKITSPEEAEYIHSEYSDAHWSVIKNKGFWEGEADPLLKTFDGIVWYRKSFTLTKAQAAQSAQIHLGPADDVDTSFINGHPIGGQYGWDTPRTYAVPSSILKTGKNVITVRVVDTGGGGGLWGPESERELVFASGETVPLAGDWRYKIASNLNDVPPPPRAPWNGGSGLSTLYNGMIAPLKPYTITGMTWYQGEANTGEADEYLRLMGLLMQNWREDFMAPKAPFIMAQLTSFGAPALITQPSNWANLRDAQRRSTQVDPYAAMAVTIDVGDAHDIHPTQKRIVAERMAREALNIANNGISSPTGTLAPAPISASLNGGIVTVTVQAHATPLSLVGHNRAIGFELCETNENCTYVSGILAGETFVLEVPNGASPKFVRYGWADTPTLNVYDRNLTPMTPFQIPIQKHKN